MSKAISGISKKILIAFIVALFLVSMIFFAFPGKVYGDIKTIYVNATSGNDTTGDGTEDNPYRTIQKGIDNALAGDTIVVGPGTYEEDITMSKPVKLIGTAGKTLIKGTITVNYVHETLAARIEDMKFLATNGHSIILNKAKNTSIVNCHFDGDNRFMDTPRINAIEMPTGSSYTSGVTIEKCTFENGYYVTIDGYAADLTVKDSKIKNVKSGINVQQGNNLVVKNTNISVIAQGAGNDTYCVRFADDSQPSSNMTINGGTFKVDKGGFTTNPGTYHSAIIIRSKAAGNLKANNINIDGEVVNLSPTRLDATNNWWGHASGPSGGVTDPETDAIANGNGSTIISSTNNVKFDPWLKKPVGYVAKTKAKEKEEEKPKPKPTPINELPVTSYEKSESGFTALFYNRILLRNPEKEGLDAWMARLKSGELTAGDLVNQFIFSEECQSRISGYTNEQFITFLYKALFNRAPEEYGFNTWMTLMNAGMTREEVVNGFTHSEEFVNICNAFGFIPYKGYVSPEG
jgi:hypothetical protein